MAKVHVFFLLNKKNIKKNVGITKRYIKLGGFVDLNFVVLVNCCNFAGRKLRIADE
jgi:hypothetical protein